MLWDSVIFYSVIVLVAVSHVKGECPDESQYTKWSTQFPDTSDDTNITINGDVVLDVADLEVFSITIDPDATLLFSDTLNITLSVHYILVDGSLIIGTEECKHQSDVLIKMLGEEGDYKIQNLDEKFIGVRKNGTLELHGKNKLPWGKLTKTIHKLDKDHGLLFRHSDEPDPNNAFRKNSLGVQVFDPSTGLAVKNTTVRLVYGSLKQHKIDDNVDAFETFLSDVDDGQVVAMAINKYIIQGDLTAFYGVINGLTGTWEIQNVPKYGAYAAVVVKGDTSKTVEEWTYDANDNINYADAELVFLDYKRKIKATSFVRRDKIGQSRNDFIGTDTDYSMPIVEMDNDAYNWDEGDIIILTSTDYDWKQTEECEVVQCDECLSNQVRVGCEPEYTHNGEFCDGYDRLDMRGEVGLLSRNIKIMGVTDDLFGGHIKMLEGHKAAHIEGIELFQMGHNSSIGRYPVHFHMCFDVGPNTYENPAYIRSNSIHHTFARATTIHGTHNCTIEYNVVWDTFGHACFLEDGGEQDNIFQWNLVGGQRKTHLLVDKKPASFWVTNPKNYYRNNIAFGGELDGLACHKIRFNHTVGAILSSARPKLGQYNHCSYLYSGIGFFFVYPVKPIAGSAVFDMMQPDEAKHTAIYEFKNCQSHSNMIAGVFIDNQLNENNVPQGYNKYEPWNDPFDESSGAKEVILPDITAYKNRQQNVWIRGGLVTLEHCSLADSFRGLTLVRENKQHPSAKKCIIVGDSCNLGKPEKGQPRSIPLSDVSTPRLGYIMQKGPQYLYDTFFGNFLKTNEYDAGALAVEFRESGKLTTLHTVSGIEFGYADATEGNRVIVKGNPPTANGDHIGTFRDADGSVTGIVGAQVVPIYDFFLTADCKRRDGWGFAACPNPYGLLIEDKGSNNLKMARDDDPTLTDLSQSDENDAVFMVILGGAYSYIMEFQDDVPSAIKLKCEACTKSDTVRIGICLPNDATFTLVGKNMPDGKITGTEWIEGSDVSDVDDDATGNTYYMDRTVGVLFLKFIHYSEREADDFNNCPDNMCVSIDITISGDLTDNLCLTNAYANDKYKRTVTVQAATPFPTVIPQSASEPDATWGAKPMDPMPMPWD